MEEKNKSFEESLLELEKIVSLLEKGELSLEESIKEYEKGMTLSVSLSKQIKDAKLKIEELKQAKDEN